jgi:hypothetical protein
VGQKVGKTQRRFEKPKEIKDLSAAFGGRALRHIVSHRQKHAWLDVFYTTRLSPA